MQAGRALARKGVRLLTCAGLLLAVTALAATPLAALFPRDPHCNCGCQHEGGKPCCCRRAARSAGPTLESGEDCSGNCRQAPPVPLRLGSCLPCQRGAGVMAPAVASRAPLAPPQVIPAVSFTYALRDRSPPS
jgi:hypothetical protein